MKMVKLRNQFNIFLFAMALLYFSGCGKTGISFVLSYPPNTRIVDNSSDVGSQFDVIMDEQGIPHIAYLETAGGELTSRLKYAILRPSDREWVTEYVDSGNGTNQKEGLYPSIEYDEVERQSIIVYREEETALEGVYTALKVARGESGFFNPENIKVLRRSGSPDLPSLLYDVGYGISTVMFPDRNIGISFIEAVPEGDVVVYKVMYMEIDPFDNIVVSPQVVKDNIAGVSKGDSKDITQIEERLPAGIQMSIDSLLTFDQNNNEIIHIFYYNSSGERAEHAYKARDDSDWKYEAIEWKLVEREFFEVGEVTVQENNTPVTKYIGNLDGVALQDKDRTTVYRNSQPIDPSEWDFYGGGDRIEILSGYSPTDVYSIDYINTKVVNKFRNGKFIRAAADSDGNLYAIYENIDHRSPVISYRDSKWWTQKIYEGFNNEEGGYSIAVDSDDEPLATYLNNYFGNLYLIQRSNGRWLSSVVVSMFDAGTYAKIVQSPGGESMSITISMQGGNLGLGGSWGSWLIYIPYIGVFR